MKKVVALVLSVVMLLCLLPAVAFPAAAATALTEGQFAAKIEELKLQYPQGKYWNDYNGTDAEGISIAGNSICPGASIYTGVPCTTLGYCGGSGYCSCECGHYVGYQCFGFANLMCYKVFGSYATTAYTASDVNTGAGWEYHTSVSNYYAGDNVRINGMHSIFITKVVDDTVYFVDCNYSGPCQIDWSRSMSVDDLKGRTNYVVRMSGNTLTGTGENHYVSVSSISISVLPKTVYYCGEDLNADGVLTVYYDNGTSVDRLITTEMVSGYDAQKIGTQTITITYEGKTTSFDVEVIEAPIADIVFNDCNYCAYGSDWDGYNYQPTFTVYFKDGTSSWGNAPYLNFYYEGEHIWERIDYSDNQQDQPWKLGNTYEVTAKVFGFTRTFNVSTVLVQDVEITPVERMFGSGYIMSSWVGENYDEYKKWMEYDEDPENITVTFTDGSSLSCSLTEFKYLTGWNCRCYSYPDQSYENQWGIGDHTAVLELANFSKEYTVTIVPSPIASIEVEDVEIIVGTNGDSYGDFFYYYLPDLTATITLTDGTIINDYYIDLGDDRYEIDIDASSQWEEPWVLGGTYEVTATLLGVSTAFNVTIVPAPIESIEIEDIELFENISGWYDEDGQFIYDAYISNAIITLTDGTVIENTYIELDGSWHWIETNAEDMQYDEPWTAGNTYEVTATLLGFSATFNVTIVPSPVASIEVEDVEIMEYSDGYITDEGFFYYYHPDLNATITLTDGTIIDNYYFELGDSWYEIDIDTSSQWDEPWVLDGTYEITATLLGATTTFTVTIVPSPIASIEVEDVEIMEYSDGYITEEGFFYYDLPGLLATITLTDGTVINDQAVEINGVYHYIEGETSQWEEPWVLGGTYEVTATLLGVSTTFNVTIVPSPIAGIEIEDIEILEYSNGYINEEGFFQYQTPTLYATVTYKDGSTEEIRNYLELSGTDYWIDDDAWEMQYDEPWTAGNTYEITASLLGVSTTFTVTIVPAPIASIKVEDMEIMEGDNGEFNGEFFRYYLGSPNAIITLTDGTVINNNHIELGNSLYWIDVNTSQDDEPWVLGGTYEVTATLLGVSTTFNVTIVPSPVESIVLEDIVLFQGIDSYDYDEYDQYYFDSVLSEVILKDGTKAEIVHDYAIKYNGQYYYVDDTSGDVQYDEHWTVGNTYTVTAYLLGAYATFNVTIQENPIEKIEFVKLPDKTEYLVGESLNLKGATLRIKYKDGFNQDITIDDEYTPVYRHSFYAERIDRNSMLNVYDYFDVAGTYTTSFEFFGVTCELPVTVKDNPIKNISIRENADTTVTITVYNSDNTSYDMTIVDVQGLYAVEENQYYAHILTDKGAFNGMIYEGQDFIKIGLNINGEEVESNSIAANKWLKRLQLQNDLFYYLVFLREFETYSGTVNADNIDTIVQVAGYLDNFDYLIWEGGAFLEDDSRAAISGEIVREAVKKYWGITDIDLSLSEYYDAQTDTYRFFEPQYGGETYRSRPDQVSYSNGVWTIAITSDNYEDVLNIKFNSDLQIISFNLNGEDYTPGDIDGVEGINDRDAIYLLMNSFFEEDYPLNQSGDFDGNGEVNDRDAIYLLMYSFFPDDYPLMNQ